METERPLSVTLQIADRYRKGCPTNGAGRKTGYGVTAKGAIDACEPYTNQAAWFVRHTRAVLLTDGSPYVDQETAAWSALGFAGDGLTPPMVRINQHLQAGRWASAVLEAAQAGYLL